MSYVICRMSHVVCHMSHVACHMSYVASVKFYTRKLIHMSIFSSIPIQYGFRQKRSTTDCVLIILAAFRSAKRKKQCMSLAFCDIARAYDSVCRELLYIKLRNIGFGGRVVAFIRSMYFNDCVRVNLNEGLSDPVQCVLHAGR